MGLENPLHLLLLLTILLLVFGAKRLPEMGRGLGDGLRGFRDAMSSHPSTPTLAAAETPVNLTGSASTPVATTVVPAAE